MTARVCRGCGRENGRAARYCAGCGRELGGERILLLRERELRSERRLVAALALLVLGTLAVLSLDAFVCGGSDVLEPIVSSLLLGTVAFGATRVLGPGTLRASLAGGTGTIGIAAGVAGGLLDFGLGWAYVLVVRAWADIEPAPVEEDRLTLFLSTVVLAPLVEEWLCRGVLWVALRRVLGAGWTTIVSAAVFALLHGLGSAGLLEYPHRFAAGLIFGALRARTGSLVPGIMAHALTNALAVAIV